MNDLEVCGKFEWERVVMRVKMHPTTKLIALTLSAHANRKGESAHPGEQRLARIVGIAPRHVREHVRRLHKDLRLIELRKHGGGGGGRKRTANEYALVLPNDLLQRAELVDLDGTNTGTSASGDSPGNTDTQTSGDPAEIDPEHRTLDEGTPDLGDTNTGPWCQNTGTSASSHQGRDQSGYQSNNHSAAWPPPEIDEELNDAKKILEALPPTEYEKRLATANDAIGPGASSRDIVIAAARHSSYPEAPAAAAV